jgi:hypothetical protein
LVIYAVGFRVQWSFTTFGKLVPTLTPRIYNIQDTGVKKEMVIHILPHTKTLRS